MHCSPCGSVTIRTTLPLGCSRISFTGYTQVSKTSFVSVCITAVIASSRWYLSSAFFSAWLRPGIGCIPAVDSSSHTLFRTSPVSASSSSPRSCILALSFSTVNCAFSVSTNAAVLSRARSSSLADLASAFFLTSEAHTAGSLAAFCAASCSWSFFTFLPWASCLASSSAAVSPLAAAMRMLMCFSR